MYVEVEVEGYSTIAQIFFPKGHPARVWPRKTWSVHVQKLQADNTGHRPQYLITYYYYLLLLYYYYYYY